MPWCSQTGKLIVDIVTGGLASCKKLGQGKLFLRACTIYTGRRDVDFRNGGAREIDRFEMDQHWNISRFLRLTMGKVQWRIPLEKLKLHNYVKKYIQQKYFRKGLKNICDKYYGSNYIVEGSHDLLPDPIWSDGEKEPESPRTAHPFFSPSHTTPISQR